MGKWPIVSIGTGNVERGTGAHYGCFLIFASVDRGWTTGEGRAEAQVVGGGRSVSWLIIAPIVVVNVAALCRKWPVNITVALPFPPPLPCPVASHTNSPKIPRCDLRVSDFRRRIYDGPRPNPIASHSAASGKIAGTR